MALLGVLARLDPFDRAQIVDRLEQIEGVSTFSVDDDNRVGILIQRSCVEQAHRALTIDVAGVRGILGAWPVFSDCDPEPAQSLDQSMEAGDDGRQSP
jgi:hypothetical protein